MWLGGLVMLVVAVLPRRDDPTVPAVVSRFSRFAFAAVVTIVATGSFQAWRQVRALDALTSTTYGRVLVVKLVVFAGLVGVAALSRRLLHRRVGVSLTARPRLAGPGAMLAGPDPELTRRLRITVGVEAALAAVILAVTAVLVNVVPAREALALPASVSVEADDVFIEVTVDPAQTGTNAIHVYTFDPLGAVRDLPAFEASLTQPERELGPIELELDRVAPGHWIAEGADIPIAGTWRLDMAARVSEFEQIKASATFEVR